MIRLKKSGVKNVVINNDEKITLEEFFNKENISKKYDLNIDNFLIILIKKIIINLQLIFYYITFSKKILYIILIHIKKIFVKISAPMKIIFNKQIFIY